MQYERWEASERELSGRREKEKTNGEDRAHDGFHQGHQHARIASIGSGPVILFLHGFPDLWYSWRHQLLSFADLGYRAIAPDLRGYGDSDSPPSHESYTLLHIVGDLVGLLDSLGVDQVFLVGHDWGAIIAWWMCVWSGLIESRRWWTWALSFIRGILLWKLLMRLRLCSARITTSAGSRWDLNRNFPCLLGFLSDLWRKSFVCYWWR